MLRLDCRLLSSSSADAGHGVGDLVDTTHEHVRVPVVKVGVADPVGGWQHDHRNDAHEVEHASFGRSVGGGPASNNEEEEL